MQQVVAIEKSNFFAVGLKILNRSFMIILFSGNPDADAKHMKVQLNSVVTNSSGPAIFVCYNRSSYRRVNLCSKITN